MVRLSPAAAVYHVTYRLRALSAAAGKPTAFQAEITMSAVFEFTDSDFSDGDLQTFGLFGVLDIVHPFVRELAHSLSGRMGLPPLLLEVKTPVAAE
jgi:preprotein translocase subunit SecB